MLMASVMAEDEANLADFTGTTYNSGSASFVTKGMAITQNGLVVKTGPLFLTPRGLYASCGNLYYGNGQITVVDRGISYGTAGNLRVNNGGYYGGGNGQTYVYGDESE